MDNFQPAFSAFVLGWFALQALLSVNNASVVNRINIFLMIVENYACVFPDQGTRMSGDLFVSRHCRQREPVVIGMPDPFVGHLQCVEVGKAPVEFGIPVDDGIFIYGDDPDLVVG